MNNLLLVPFSFFGASIWLFSHSEICKSPLNTSGSTCLFNRTRSEILLCQSALCSSADGVLILHVMQKVLFLPSYYSDF